ncbi:MAG: type III pantothenate kinase [Bacteroidales bacterium]|nr:type III pantothenate kinase [Bacteroidales bacterium]
MILTIDRGNTNEKFAVFDNDKIVYSNTVTAFDEKHIKDLCDKFSLDEVIYCSVKDELNDKEFETLFEKNKTKIYSAKTLFQKSLSLFYENKTKFQKDKTLFRYPFKNNYLSKETLGQDRLVAMIGAWAMYGKSVLVIDAGTCITFDYLDEESTYQGGAISVGFMIKYKALHNFTANLPLLNDIGEVSLCGKTTYDCIKSGVINGTLSEIEGIIEKYCKQNGELKVVLTGGDAEFLHKHLEKETEYVPDLIFYGLKNILEINAEEN